MQIRNIVIYKNINTEPRIISFKLGKVNIITGESKTGKTALIDIIDYCLGSKSCNVKGHIIRSTVEWFAITIQLENSQIFVARQNPTFLKVKNTASIYFLAGDKLTIPAYEMLIPNSNTSALTNYISDTIGIDNNLNIPESPTRENLEASFRHSRAFSFQPQNVIAEYKYLFFNQDDNFKEIAMKDTLPYILGAIREDELIIRQSIRLKNRELNKLIREKKQEEVLISKSMRKLLAFLDEAKEAELIDKNFSPANENELIKKLNELNLSSLPKEKPSIVAKNEILSNLIEENNKLKREISGIDSEIKAVEDYSDLSTNYSKEVDTQKDRLLSIGLFKEPVEHDYWNSLLGEEVDSIPPTIELINNSLKELTYNLTYTKRRKPKIQKLLIELNDKRALLTERASEVRKSINNIYKQNKDAAKYKDLNILKGRTLGRIGLFLETMEVSQGKSTLVNRIKHLKQEISSLEELISNKERDSKLEAILNKINILMTSWREMLDWEYQKANLRFDIKKLTLFADTDERSESLQEMGSGENWLACHLFIHFALHKHFIDKNRPVANFIVFDQPTQIHYPKNYQELDGKIIKSEDEKADERMFNFIFNITKILSPNLQVIVTDHANFENKKFQKAIVEEWRYGKKLVPTKWLEEN